MSHNPGRTFNSRFRDRVLTVTSAYLSRTQSPLWYLETMVLSARYQQFLRASDWAAGCRRFSDRVALWEGAAAPALAKGEFTGLEFGVADGMATHWWAERGIRFRGWHGFDTFEGLPADWVRGEVAVMAAGVFTPAAGAGSVPEVSAPWPYTWHRGLIEQTLPQLQRPQESLFVLIDVDLGEPTGVILDWLREQGRPGDLVYFDEAFDPWNEGLALRQALARGLRIRGLAHTGSALLVELV